MLELVRSLVEAAGPFMQHQTSVEHFEFLGLDIIADEGGGVWLMEGEIACTVGVSLWCRLIFAYRCTVSLQSFVTTGTRCTSSSIGNYTH